MSRILYLTSRGATEESPSHGATPDVYDVDYFEPGVQRPGRKSNYVRYRNAQGRSLARELSTMLVEEFQPHTSLDVGCATGMLVSGLHALGVNARGCDVSRWAVANVDPQIAGRVVQAAADEIPYLGPFDLVTCTEMLEHVAKETVPTVLRELRALCSRWLYLSIHLLPGSGQDLVEFDAKDATHVTIATRDWWDRRLGEAGFIPQPTIEQAFQGSSVSRRARWQVFVRSTF